MNLCNKKIGIWGLGIAGKAALCYLHKCHAQLTAMDRRSLSNQEHIFLEKHNVIFYNEDNLEAFFDSNESVFVSSGINHHACHQYKHKIISELDLFCVAYTKPIIAVTGSVGKTTIVHLLSHILKNDQLRIGVGGNIGIGMLDLIEHQKNHDAALLELSSFQLERSHSFAPNLAIWTNFYPNHLDWHGSQESYFHAKQNIIYHQSNGQKALLPLCLIEQLKHLYKKKIDWYFFTTETLSDQQRYLIQCYAQGIFYTDKNNIILEEDKRSKILLPIDQFPSITFLENWLIIYATLYLLNRSINPALISKLKFTLPEHRLEYVVSINGIDFYNDSKATTSAATLAAINRLRSHPIILLLGGISKGINRAALIKHSDNAVKIIVCFGKERQELEDLCLRYNKIHCSFETLDEAFSYSIITAQPGDQILLSPAGASFDQFANYQERGTYFKKLVYTYKKKVCYH